MNSAYVTLICCFVARSLPNEMVTCAEQASIKEHAISTSSLMQVDTRTFAHSVVHRSAYHKADKKGYCFPTSTHSGDLCRPPIAALETATCEGVDGNFYLPEICGEECAQSRCDADSGCKGYTKRLTDGRFKLKGRISTVSEHGDYECYSKERYVMSTADGYCSPAGESGGDLCKTEDPGSETPENPSTCDGVDSFAYLSTSCGLSCARSRCDQDSHCVGYTRRESDGAFKLKSEITGIVVHMDVGYECWRKLTGPPASTPAPEAPSPTPLPSAKSSSLKSTPLRILAKHLQQVGAWPT